MKRKRTFDDKAAEGPTKKIKLSVSSSTASSSSPSQHDQLVVSPAKPRRLFKTKTKPVFVPDSHSLPLPMVIEEETKPLLAAPTPLLLSSSADETTSHVPPAPDTQSLSMPPSSFLDDAEDFQPDSRPRRKSAVNAAAAIASTLARKRTEKVLSETFSPPTTPILSSSSSSASAPTSFLTTLSSVRTSSSNLLSNDAPAVPASPRLNALASTPILTSESDGAIGSSDQAELLSGGSSAGREKAPEALADQPTKVFFVTAGSVSRKGDREENQDAFFVDEVYDLSLFDTLDGVHLDPAARSSEELLKAKAKPRSKAKAKGKAAKTKEKPKLTKKQLRAIPVPRRSIAIHGVFDGHGPLGKEAAQYVLDTFPQAITQHLPPSNSVFFEEDQVQTAIRVTLAQIQKDLIQLASSKDPSIQEFGTTFLASVLWGGDNLTVTNVGDCRGVLYRMANQTNGGVDQVIPMSLDHDFTRVDERNRITLTNGKIVENRGGCHRLIPSTNDYPIEVIKEQKLALALSRSLGHIILSKYGVSSEPEFKTTKVQDKDILVMASDGLWQVLSNQDVQAILMEVQDPEKAAKKLASTALRINDEGGLSSDNTTVVVTQFHFEKSVILPSRPKASTTRRKLAHASAHLQRTQTPELVSEVSENGEVLPVIISATTTKIFPEDPEEEQVVIDDDSEDES